MFQRPRGSSLGWCWRPQPVLPFHELETLHYARLVLIDRKRGPALLAFSTDYDGPEGESAGSGKAEVSGNTLAAGEFLLGHADGYGNITHSPQSPNGFNFGLNGSYLVLRQLEQDVPAFRRYCTSQGQDAILVASKMVGRWPSGAPLLRHLDRDPDDARFSDEDTFSYIANDEDNDRYGASCPFGAHIRRSNPRAA